MRILILTQYFWPESFGINELVKSLVKKGITVDVLTGKPNYPEGVVFPGYRVWGCQNQCWNDATVYRVPIMPRGTGSGVRLALNYISFVVSCLLFGTWLIRKQHYDAIFVYAPSPILQAIPAIFLGWLKHCKVIVWVQDLWPESLAATGFIRNPYILGGLALVVRWIYRCADLLLVQSRAFEEPVRKLVSDKPVAYYPNSGDMLFCFPPENVALPDIAQLNSGFSVMFAGNVGTAQAVETIMEAAFLLKDCRQINFIIFGHGSKWDWVREQVVARGLTNVHLPGRFPIETMPGLMQKASALLVTLADQPIFRATIPSKIQAYMAAGRPIIACMNGEGARVVLEAKAGLAVPAEDARALADAVQRLSRMAMTEREKLGTNARDYFTKHFDHNLLVDALIKHFQEISLPGR